MTIKTYETAVRAGAILAAITLSGGAFGAGASGDSYSFEGGTTLGSGDLAGLTGNGTVVAATYTAAAKTSQPLPAAAHASVLEIAGTVAYTNVTAFNNDANNASQVDFMFKVEPADEALEAPGGADIQVALAVGVTNANGTTAPIQLYCKTASDAAAGWTTIAAEAATGSWMRATLVMDYSNNTCKVSLDSDPVNGGAKYYFAGTTLAQNYVKSITMVGSTQIDDLVVKNESLATFDPYKNAAGQDLTVTAGSTPVTVKYLNDYGVTQAQATSNEPLDASGLTVEQKYVAGLDPKSGTKFELQTMTPGAENTAVVTFPGNNASGYTVKVTVDGDVASTVTTSTATGATVEGGEALRSATVTLPADKLAYITVEATK